MSGKPGDKFVLEIKDCAGTHRGGTEKIFKVQGAEDLFPERFLNNLDRLDSDYIDEHYGDLQDEAYEVGKKAGIDIGEFAGYKKGMNEAWEIARKLLCVDGINGIDEDDLKDIFPGLRICGIFKIFTPQEVKAKIEAWEKSKAEIKVGDVVTHDKMGVHIITNINENGFYTLMSSDGRCACSKRQYLTKTGRTIDIASVLEQIGGSR